MELSELIAAVKAATTKNDLAELVKAELSLDLNKNKTLKVLRAEVLNGLGVTEDADQGVSEDDEQQLEPETVAAPVDAPDAKPDADDKQVIIPAAEEPPEPEVVAAPASRILRSTDTGREFIWTAALAVLPEMEEV
jgi:hypothetical protein